MIIVIMFWLMCGVAGGAMLSRYNKAGTGFVLGFLLGPIGLLIAWTMRDSAKLDEASTAAGGQRPDASPRVERPCPYCAEKILIEARVCKHCGRDVDPFIA